MTPTPSQRPAATRRMPGGRNRRSAVPRGFAKRGGLNLAGTGDVLHPVVATGRAAHYGRSGAPSTSHHLGVRSTERDVDCEAAFRGLLVLVTHDV